MKTNIALKEWHCNIAALKLGLMDVLIRKGGILEQKEGFKVEHREFYLFPTYVHQKKDALDTKFQNRWPELAGVAPQEGSVSFELFAKVKAVHEIKNLDEIKKWDGRHAYNWKTIEERFHYRNKPGLHVIELEIEKLKHPIKIQNSRDYDGCLSWVEIKF